MLMGLSTKDAASSSEEGLRGSAADDNGPGEGKGKASDAEAPSDRTAEGCLPVVLLPKSELALSLVSAAEEQEKEKEEEEEEVRPDRSLEWRLMAAARRARAYSVRSRLCRREAAAVGPA